MTDDNVKKPLRGYTTKQLAALGGVTDARIRQLLAEGALDGYKVGDVVWVIPARAARAWLDARGVDLEDDKGHG